MRDAQHRLGGHGRHADEANEHQCGENTAPAGTTETCHSISSSKLAQRLGVRAHARILSRPQTNLSYFRNASPPRAPSAAVKFTGLRHVPLAAQDGTLPNLWA